MSVLIFDSGIGGLSVLREARVLLPEHQFIYVADNAAFPYGDWTEEALLERMTRLFGAFISQYQPDICVIACNTASTLAISHLRQVFPQQLFVGTVPAIKPAAERTKSGFVSVLATPGTVKRQYTRDLISEWANKCYVRLVASTRLARLAEDYLHQGYVDEAAVLGEIEPCFVRKGNRQTDIVVLACTHYPFLVNRMRKVAPWPVDWIDTSEAIARRTLDLMMNHDTADLGNAQSSNHNLPELGAEPDIAICTAGFANGSQTRLLQGFGLTQIECSFQI